MRHATMNRPTPLTRLLALPGRRHAAPAAALLVAVGLGLALVGCAPRTSNPPPSPPPAAIYSGPEHLKGTVGSMATLRNYDPLLVSGWGLVVGLDGTGSQEVPAFLRQQMINRLRQMGVGSTRTRRDLPEELQAFARMSPEQVLANPGTAVVAVQGFLPPGGVRGARFDVLVSALPQTQTTSLAGGILWTTDLGIDGTNAAMPFTRTRAEASGPIYINPFDEESDEKDKQRFLRQAVVVSGGRVTLPQQIELVLNQPSWNRSRAIADRINERFPAGPGERVQTAMPQTSLIIRINVPRRNAMQPDMLMDLIAHLYTQRGADFEVEQAQRLARVLRNDPSQSRPVVLAWRSLGRTILPVLRDHYQDEQPHIALAALEAGAWLTDERAGLVLSQLAEHEEASVRRRVAEALVYLPRNSMGTRTLQSLLDDHEVEVRIAAYESLSEIRDPIVDRMVIPNQQRGAKFVIDRVPSDNPLIYITQEQFPRLVIFGEQLGFRTPLFAHMWDSRLMVRAETDDEPLSVYYQKPGTIEGRSYDVWPSVAGLAYMMAHPPTAENKHQGLDLTYSQVVETVYRLTQNGAVPAPVELSISPLAQLVAEYESIADSLRPEIGEETPEPLFGPEPLGDDQWLERPGQRERVVHPRMRTPGLEQLGDPTGVSPEMDADAELTEPAPPRPEN